MVTEASLAGFGDRFDLRNQLKRREGTESHLSKTIERMSVDSA